MNKSGNDYSLTDWGRIQRIGLKPDVTTPEIYSQRAALGMRLATATLSLTKEVIPSVDTVKGIHYVAFESIHPWAGTFRKPGQEVQVGNLICSAAKDINRDLASLQKEMLENPLKGTRKYLSEVLGFYHASFLAIHPFLDGNGRISRAILDNQSKTLLGHPLTLSFSRPEYMEALNRAQQEGDLSKLSRIIGNRSPDKSISIQVPGDGPERISGVKALSRPELLKREKELLTLRRKLGFVGTEIDSQYGLGGYPAVLTEKAAASKARGIVESRKGGDKNPEQLALELLIEDRAVNQDREFVSRELLGIREQLLKRARLEGKGHGVGKKR